MALNYNKVILSGRLAADPELKTTQSGVSVTSFTLAVDRRTAKGEERKTDFLDCTAWREKAEFITRFFHKGSALFVEGELQKRSWEDQHGNKRSAVEVVVTEAKFVENKYDATAPAPPAAPSFEDVPDNGDLPF